jgi:hypothetical protein
MRIACILAAACVPMVAESAVTFDIDAEIMRGRPVPPATAGTPIPEGTGLFLLVADTLGNGFGQPTSSSFVSGDDIQLAEWTATVDPNLPDGVLFTSTGPLSFSLDPAGNWGEGDPVGLYWFPTLNPSSGSPGEGTEYGFYTDPVGRDNGDVWVTPPDSQVQDRIWFLTTDSGFGTNPPEVASATLTVVPEPSTYAAAAGLLCLGWAAYSRRSKRTAK